MSGKNRRRIAPVSRYVGLETLIGMSGRRDIFPFYHLISDKPLPHIRHMYSYRDIRGFETDLEYMLKYFEPIGMSEYLRMVNRPRGKRFMVLSFDDGLAECYDHIVPVLKRKGVPALFLLNNRFIDNHDLFYRYKASLLVERVTGNRAALESVAEFLAVPEEQVVRALMMVNYRQRSLLDALAPVAEVDFRRYLDENPVYLDSAQIREMVDQGFGIGGHSDDHADFSLLEPGEIREQVAASLDDLEERFGSVTRYFSFPFTTSGIPAMVIHGLLDNGTADALLGTGGLKITGRKEYIQRIPMEALGLPAMDTLKAEYLYYILKKPLGKNRI